MSISKPKAKAKKHCCELNDYEIGDRMPIKIRHMNPMYGYPKSRYSIDLWRKTWTCEGGVTHSIVVLNDVLQRRTDE
jgi:hypothetical protein|tara:strand:+ start:2511 stop:2741 length:231 start_codon:yes stop_codon:yes gene_type:complete